jgi:hypothetical protein
LHCITLQLQLKEYIHNYNLQLVQQFVPRKWHNLTNRKATMTTTRLTTHMEDMAENIDMDMTNAEEETKEEPTKRNAMSVSSLGVGQVNILQRNTNRHIKDSANMPNTH